MIRWFNHLNYMQTYGLAVVIVFIVMILLPALACGRNDR